MPHRISASLRSRPWLGNRLAEGGLSSQIRNGEGGFDVSETESFSVFTYASIQLAEFVGLDRVVSACVVSA